MFIMIRKEGNIATMKKALAAAAVLTAILTGCGSKAFYEIDNGDIVGCIKNYDKNDDISRIKETVLRRHMDELSGDAVFVNVIILGEADGKIYTQNTYTAYEYKDSEPHRTGSDSEFAAFETPDDINYESVDLGKAFLDGCTFLPESISANYTNETFDMYVYFIGNADENLSSEAAEYFTQ